MLKRQFYFLFSCFLLLFIQSLHAQEKLPNSLSLGFMPYLTANQLTQKYTPLAEYLSKKLSIPVTLHISKDYQEHIQKVGEDNIDIAFLGGNSYIKIVEKYGKKPLLVRYEMRGKPTFHGIIFVTKNSPLKELKDLSGQRVAFGDRNSTLSAQVPQYMLVQAGIPLNKLAGYDFLKNHENVIYGVTLGDYAAGALAEEVFNEYEKKGIRILATSPPISTHIFVTSTHLPASLVERIRQILLDLKQDAEGQTVLAKIGKEMTGFAPVTDSDYDTLREILKAVTTNP